MCYSTKVTAGLNNQPAKTENEYLAKLSQETKMEGYKISATTIHFSVQNPLPDDMVKKIVQVQMKENKSPYQEKENYH